MPGVVKTERRRVLVHFTKANGTTDTVEREVFFARGFGEYVRHMRRFYLVDPMQTEVRIDLRSPSAPDPDAA